MGVPLAGATLPVISFFLLGIYGRVVWLLIATIILGVGHIGIHMQQSKESKVRVNNPDGTTEGNQKMERKKSRSE